MDKGNEDELTEFEIKKQEKQKNVEELRAKLSDLKIKEDETRGNMEYSKGDLVTRETLFKNYKENIYAISKIICLLQRNSTRKKQHWRNTKRN